MEINMKYYGMNLHIDILWDCFLTELSGDLMYMFFLCFLRCPRQMIRI